MALGGEPNVGPKPPISILKVSVPAALLRAYAVRPSLKSYWNAWVATQPFKEHAPHKAVNIILSALSQSLCYLATSSA